MAVRTATYALDRQVPYLIEQGITQTLDAPIRYGPSGALVTVTEAGSTVTITQPDGTDLVSAAAVTVSSSTATYDVTTTTAETLGSGWLVVWSLVIGGETYVFRQTAYLCEYVPHLTVSISDLYARMPDLAARIPQSQGTRGTNVGWQPQLDEAYYEFLRWLLADGREPHRITDATGYHDYVLARALQLCVQAIPGGLDDRWSRSSRELHFEVQRARAAMRIQMEYDDAGVRRGGSAVIRLAPTGRPTW